MIAPSPAAIRTEGLTKRFRTTVALDQLDLEVRTGEVFGLLGPNGAGEVDHGPAAAGPASSERGPRADLRHRCRRRRGGPSASGLCAGRCRPRPNLTGAETLALLGNLGSIRPDRAYQTELVERFKLQVKRRCGTYSTGNRQKVR